MMMNKSNPNIFIETEMNYEKLQAIAYLQRPSLFLDESIDFQTREINEKNYINFTVLNPSDHPLEFSLFLAPEEYSNVSFIKDVLIRYFGYFHKNYKLS